MKTRLLVHGRILELAWWGPVTSDHPPIVLLHEGLGSVSGWRSFPEALAARAGLRVMAYSRFGHGASDPPAIPHDVPFMHAEAQLLPTILDLCDVERAILLGHSDGGSIALIAAAESPERVAALILEAPHVFVEPISIESIQRIKTRFVEGDLRERLFKHHVNPDVVFHGWNDVWLDPAFLAWNLEGYLPRIACPVLLIQGRDDEYGTLAQIESIARHVAGPVAQLVLEECGHSPHKDQPEKVLEAIAAFVDREDS